jgi:uncharacterized protein (DUF2062 family)
MGLLRRRVIDPLLGQLRQGVTPERLAWSLALGLALGIFPVLGATTLLCLLVAAALRLNQPAIQLVNYLAYPLQLLLLLPLLQAGQRLFGLQPLSITPAGLRAEAAAGLGALLSRYGGALLRAVLVWAIVAVPLALLVRLLLRPLLARLPLPQGPPGPAAPPQRPEP